MNKLNPIKVVINIKPSKHRGLPDTNYIRRDVDLGDVKRMVTFVFEEPFKYDFEVKAVMYFLFDPVPELIPNEFTIVYGSKTIGVCKLRHD